MKRRAEYTVIIHRRNRLLKDCLSIVAFHAGLIVMNRSVSLRSALALASVYLLSVIFIALPSASAESESARTAARPNPFTGVVREATTASTILGRNINYLVYLPANYDAQSSGAVRYPVIYLLHGRGDTMKAWLTLKTDFDALIASGETPPFIAIMPDAPSNQRAGYYIDSAFAGKEGVENSAGERVETAFSTELIPHVDSSYRTLADRQHRIVGGYSMGGYGAIHYALAHSGLFGAAIVLSPAVYFPLPPPQSSTREFGAYGDGSLLFAESIYRAKNYPATIPHFAATGHRLYLFIAVGDDEVPQKDPREAGHDLDYEAHTLYNVLRRVPRITAQLRVVEGGHNWDTWRPTFLEGARCVFRMLDRDRAGAEVPASP